MSEKVAEDVEVERVERAVLGRSVSTCLVALQCVQGVLCQHLVGFVRESVPMNMSALGTLWSPM